MKKQHWKALCSFAHTGYRQVTRRYSGGQLKPSYSDHDLQTSMDFAVAAGLLAAAELAALSRDEYAERAVIVRMKQYVASKKARGIAAPV